MAEVGEGYCRLDDGRRIDTDAVLLATKAAPAPWFRSSGLACTADGFLALRPTLQLVGDDDIFAAGDCGTVLEHPRAKAGVFAVRQGPPLTENLRRRARGRDVLPFKPQKEFLTILSSGIRTPSPRAVPSQFLVPGSGAGRTALTVSSWRNSRFCRRCNPLQTRRCDAGAARPRLARHR